MYNTKQLAANASGRRYVIHQGGTGSGKTYAALQYLLYMAFIHNNLIISVVAESLPHLKRGAIRDFKRIATGIGMAKYITENKTDHTFTVSNSLIEFFSADAEAKLRGARRDILFINECNNVSYDAFQQLDVRTRYQTILDFNPVRRFWVHDNLLPMLYTAASLPSKGGHQTGTFIASPDSYQEEAISSSKVPPSDGSEAIFIKSTYLDNEHLSTQEKQNIERRRTNLNWWKVYGEGEIGMAEGVIFSNWSVTDTFSPHKDVDKETDPSLRGTKQSSQPNISNHLPGTLLGYGIDFGFTHSPTAIVQVNEYNGELYVHELLYRNGMQNDEMFAFAQKHINLKALAVADSAEPKTIDYLYRKGWLGLKPASKGTDSVEFGINLLLDRKINVTVDSVNLIKELRQYMWDTNKDGQIVHRPVKDFDHAIDALRYVYSYPKKKKLAFV